MAYLVDEATFRVIASAGAAGSTIAETDATGADLAAEIAQGRRSSGAKRQSFRKRRRVPLGHQPPSR